MNEFKIELRPKKAKDVKPKETYYMILDLVCDECGSPLAFQVKKGNVITVVPCRKCTDIHKEDSENIYRVERGK